MAFSVFLNSGRWEVHNNPSAADGSKILVMKSL